MSRTNPYRCTALIAFSGIIGQNSTTFCTKHFSISSLAAKTAGIIIITDLLLAEKQNSNHYNHPLHFLQSSGTLTLRCGSPGKELLHFVRCIGIPSVAELACQLDFFPVGNDILEFLSA